MASPYRRIHVVINPASGKDQPMLNIINDTCRRHAVEWDATVTHKFGDATEQARAAIAAGVDLVAGYGGDGTQHEIANAILSSERQIPLAILPGGTGNGFCRENNVPDDLQAAVELMCTGANLRHVDAAKIGDQYFIQRLFTGIEPEQQTSREMKSKYGVLAYAMTVKQQAEAMIEAQYRLTIDGQVIEARGTRCYIINSGMSGKGWTLDQNFSATDGLLDVLLLNRDLAHVEALAERYFALPGPKSGLHSWQGKVITIESDPDRPVWTDGEYIGRTPITATVTARCSGRARTLRGSASMTAIPKEKTAGWGVIAMLAAAQFIMVLDTTVMNVSITQVAEDLNTTVIGLQTAITMYTLVMAAFMLLGGKLGDRWGAKRAFIIGLLVYGAGSLTTALSPTLGVLLVGWSFIEGFGAILVIPAIAALTAGTYTGRQRALAYGILGGVSGASAALGSADRRVGDHLLLLAPRLCR